VVCLRETNGYGDGLEQTYVRKPECNPVHTICRSIQNCGPAVFSAAHIFFAGKRVDFNVLAVGGFPGEVSTKLVYDDRVAHISWRNKVNEWQSMEFGIKSYSYGVVVIFVFLSAEGLIDDEKYLMKEISSSSKDFKGSSGSNCLGSSRRTIEKEVQGCKSVTHSYHKRRAEIGLRSCHCTIKHLEIYNTERQRCKVCAIKKWIKGKEIGEPS
jgi:hypothetical protein